MPPRSLTAVILPFLVTGGLVLAAVTPDDPNAQVKSLTLGEAEATALRNQPSLTQARGLLEAAEGRVEESRAGYLPQVTLNGTYERTTGNFAPRPGLLPSSTGGTGGTTGTGGSTGSSGAAPASVSWNPQFNYYILGATATQLIYDFGQTSGRWRSSAASRDAAFDNTRTAEVQTLLNVRRAYFLVRAQHDLVAVADEAVRNQEKHVEQTRAFVKTGIQPDINLATVLTALANAKVQLVTAQNNFEVAEAQRLELCQASATGVRRICHHSGYAGGSRFRFIAAAAWPNWYSNASDVVIDDPSVQLGEDVNFSWTTFGFKISSKVAEFAPYTRLGWYGNGDQLRAYHTWLLVPRLGDSTYVVMEEIGMGDGARHLAQTNPGHMHRGHDLWNISLKFACEA